MTDQGSKFSRGKGAPPAIPKGDRVEVELLNTGQMARLGIIEEPPATIYYQIMNGPVPATTLEDVSRILAKNPSEMRRNAGFYDERNIVHEVPRGTYALARPAGSASGPELVRHNDDGTIVSTPIEEIISKGLRIRDEENARITAQLAAERKSKLKIGVGAAGVSLVGIAALVSAVALYTHTTTTDSIFANSQNQAREQYALATADLTQLASSALALNKDVATTREAVINTLALVREIDADLGNLDHWRSLMQEDVRLGREDLAGITTEFTDLNQRYTREILPIQATTKDQLERLGSDLDIYKELPGMAQGVRQRAKWEIKSYAWLVEAAAKSSASHRQFISYMGRFQNTIGQRMYRESQAEIRGLLAQESTTPAAYHTAMGDLVGSFVDFGPVPKQNYASVVNGDLRLKASDCADAKNKLVLVVGIDPKMSDRHTTLMRDVICTSPEAGTYVVTLKGN
ncbi:hypothetical protein HYV86_01205 [Candidatus Woesearchaeota archaeon]|nr:hypothetical protein [Candidatus Woesearchaeota archaeon]